MQKHWFANLSVASMLAAGIVSSNSPTGAQEAAGPAI